MEMESRNWPQMKVLILQIHLVVKALFVTRGVLIFIIIHVEIYVFHKQVRFLIHDLKNLIIIKPF